MEIARKEIVLGCCSEKEYDRLKKMVQLEGGIIKETLSYNTDYLILGSIRDWNEKKLRDCVKGMKCEEHPIQMYTIKEWDDLYEPVRMKEETVNSVAEQKTIIQPKQSCNGKAFVLIGFSKELKTVCKKII